MRILTLLLEDRLPAIKSKFGEKTLNAFKHTRDYENHKNITADKLINELALADPTEQKEYTQWIVTAFIREPFGLEDLNLLHAVLAKFHTLKKRKKLDVTDINKFKTRTDLFDYLDKFEDSESKSIDVGNDTKTELVKSGEAEIYYRDSSTLIVIPRTRVASCEFGSGTRWCTAGATGNMFDTYSKSGTLYIINHKGVKYQLHISNNGARLQLADSSDRMLNIDEFFQNYPSILEVFRDKLVGAGMLEYSTDKSRLTTKQILKYIMAGTTYGHNTQYSRFMGLKDYINYNNITDADILSLRLKFNHVNLDNYKHVMSGDTDKEDRYMMVHETKIWAVLFQKIPWTTARIRYILMGRNAFINSQFALVVLHVLGDKFDKKLLDKVRDNLSKFSTEFQITFLDKFASPEEKVNSMVTNVVEALNTVRGDQFTYPLNHSIMKFIKSLDAKGLKAFIIDVAGKLRNHHQYFVLPVTDFTALYEKNRNVLDFMLPPSIAELAKSNRLYLPDLLKVLVAYPDDKYKILNIILKGSYVMGNDESKRIIMRRLELILSKNKREVIKIIKEVPELFKSFIDRLIMDDHDLEFLHNLYGKSRTDELLKISGLDKTYPYVLFKTPDEYKVTND